MLTPHSRHSPPPSEAAPSGLRRQNASLRLSDRRAHEPFEEAANGLTERRRSRTDRAWGCHTAQVLKPWRVGRGSGCPKPFEAFGSRSRHMERHSRRSIMAPGGPAVRARLVPSVVEITNDVPAIGQLFESVRKGRKCRSYEPSTGCAGSCLQSARSLGRRGDHAPRVLDRKQRRLLSIS